LTSIYHCQELKSVVIVTIGNGVMVHSVILTCDVAFFSECFPKFF